MASEIKVDTISEKTSANGVSIDSVKLKDEDGNPILDSEGNQDYSWGLNTRAIVATLVKTVQELEERIKTLENA